MSTAASPTLYDEFRYPGKFYPQASPERMATLGTLYGLKPPPVETSRILEVGCGEGGHLIPVAYALKNSRCLGVDLSQTSLERARETAARLGIANAEFRSLDLMQFPADAGTFDYIIAHGLFSWIPPEVQDKLLEICGRHLSPTGVAYVSYNTYPAGHLRQITRDLMRFHTRHITDPATKVREAKRIVDFVISASPQTLERELMRREAAIHKASDPLLFFDALAEVNEPLYFLDFMEQAAAYGLQFVAESDIHRMQTARLPEPARAQLDAVPDRLLREQYLDFIHCRGFRQTILCRAGHDLDLNVTPERMEHLMVVGFTRPAGPVGDAASGDIIEFRNARGQTARTAEALPKAVYLELGEAWPRALSYPELRQRACRRAGLDGTLDPETEAKLIRMLVSSLANALVDFHIYQPPFCAEVSERPLASAVARWEAEAGKPVTSLMLGSAALQEPELRSLLPLLDGTRDQETLRAELQRSDPQFTTEQLRGSLERLAEYGLLEG
jgi:SAM-dependent methyltransferase/methyltransferase-like protein